ncbi:hypothetical protein GC170_19675 [bacterium]|nr:hypothetical protein [bacterium]
MMTRRVVMMAFAVSFGSAMSASAQTPANSTLIEILKRSARNSTVIVQPTVSGNLVPVGTQTPGTSNTTLKVSPLLVDPKAPPPTECGPRPPRQV